MKKVIFLGSKPIGYYCFAHLIEYHLKHKIELIGLLSNDNPTLNPALSLKKLAQEYNIPIIQSLDEMPTCDILYSVQYHQILQQKHIDKASQITLNLHMAPLPAYRGCNQFSFAILDNVTTFGTTIHQIDARIDHGDIAFEKHFSIPQNCWVEDLYQLTYEASIHLFKETLPAIIANNIELISQQSLVAERGTSIHYRNEINAIKQIDLYWDKEKIERHIRATYMPPFEPPYVLVNEQKIYFQRQDIA